MLLLNKILHHLRWFRVPINGLSGLSSRICVCIYIYVYTYVHVYICIYIYTQQKYCVYTICIHWCSIFSINNSRPISQLLNIRHFASLRRCASTISSTHATSGAASLSVRQTTTSRPGEETLWKQRFLCEDFWGDNMKACQLVVVLFLSFLFGGYICVHFTNSKGPYVILFRLTNGRMMRDALVKCFHPRAPLAHCRSKRKPTLRAPAGPTFLCSRTYSKG